MDQLHILFNFMCKSNNHDCLCHFYMMFWPTSALEQAADGSFIEFAFNPLTYLNSQQRSNRIFQLVLCFFS